MSTEEAEDVIARNRRVCLTFRFFQSIFLGGSLMTTYYLDLGLSQTQIFILQTVLGVVNVTADIPFGFLADRIGIRKVLIIGSTLLLVQSTYFAQCTTFWQFVLALIGTGLYMAALNNSTNAAMALTLRMRPAYNPADYRTYLKQASRMGNLGYILGMISGGLLASVGDLSWPYRVQPLISLTCLVCAFRLIDPVLKSKHADRGTILKAVRTMLVDRRDIRYMIGVQSGFFLYINLILWILQPRLGQAGIPIYAYSAVYVSWAFVVLCLNGFAEKVSPDKAHPYWVLLIVSSTVGAAVAGLTTGLVGVIVLMVGLSIVSAFALRLFDSYLDEVLPKDGLLRNTELAVGSTVPMLVFSIISPFFGMLVDTTSVGMGLVTVSVLCSAFITMCYTLFRREVKRQ